MLFAGAEYTRRNWIMQLHYGYKRDNNTPMFDSLGPDTGYDCINNYAPSSEMADFLDALNKNGNLPKTIIYNLNPNDNQAIDTILDAFRIPQPLQKSSKVPHGGSTITKPVYRIRWSPLQIGEFPADYDTLEEIIKGICYNNAVNYFEFHLKTC